MADPEVTIPPPDPPDPTNRSGGPPPSSKPDATGPSEGTEPSSPSPNSTSWTPPWLKWSKGLNSLLDDPQGRDLFEKYLEHENCSNQLHFLWACEGLKQTAIKDPPKISQLVRKIYTHFIQNQDLFGIEDDTRSDLAQAMVDRRWEEISIFNKTEEEVLTHMQNNLYPNFLQSELYLCAVNGEEYSSSSISVSALEKSGSPERRQSIEDVSLASSSTNLGGVRSTTISSNPVRSSSSSKVGAIDPLTGESVFLSNPENLSPRVPSPPLSSYPNIHPSLLPNELQTVHEDQELTTPAAGPSCSSSSQLQAHSASAKYKFKLTEEALAATQSVRSSTGGVRTNEPVSHSQYLRKAVVAPVEALFPYHAKYSSYNPVSRVDSEIQSLSSGCMSDRDSHHGERRSGHSSSSRAQSHGIRHHHPDRRQAHRIPGVPVDARLDNVDNLHLPTSAREHQQRAALGQIAQTDPQKFAQLVIQKLKLYKKNQDKEQQLSKSLSESEEHPEPNVLAAAIKAINKIQNRDDSEPVEDILDNHVSRVFPGVTPKTRSPRLRSPTVGRRRGGGSSQAAPSFPLPRRRDRDVVSGYISGDSGNVRDYSSLEASPMVGNLGMAKSRSIPYELRMQQEHGDFSFGRGPTRGHHHPRGGGMSNLVPTGGMPTMPWKTSMEFVDSGISVVSESTQPPVPQIPVRMPSHHEGGEPSRVQDWIRQLPSTAGTDPNLKRRLKVQSQINQNPEATLEEVSKRLIKTSLTKAALDSSSQLPVNLSSGCGGYSFASTAAPRSSHSPPSSEDSISLREHIPTLIMYSEGSEDPVPYSLKIPKMRLGTGSGITLGVFKEHLPKKGSYRYFFKTKCPDLDSQVVQEEISDDSQELPLHEGRICALLQRILTS